MVAVGTAHHALLTRCGATLPGPATRSTSSALDGCADAFRSLDGGRSTEGSGAPTVCARNIGLSTPALVDQKIDKYGCAGPRLFCGGPRRRNATTLRPVSLCAVTVRRASASARLDRTSIPRSVFPEFAPALSGSLRGAKQEPRSDLLQCLKPGSLAPGRQAPDGSQT